jgi:hypothetical protein
MLVAENDHTDWTVGGIRENLELFSDAESTEEFYKV